MINKQRFLRLILLCIIFSMCTAHAQAQIFSRLFGKKKTQASLSKKIPVKVKTYDDIITKNFKTYKGLFTVHRNKDTTYFEIPDSIMHREIMVINRLRKSSLGTGIYPWEELDQRTIQFELGPDSTVRIVYDVLLTEADSASNIYKAVKNTNAGAVAYTFPIATGGRNHTGYVIDVSKLFTEASFVNSYKEKDDPAKFSDPKDYHLDYVHAYPINVEIGLSENISVHGSIKMQGNIYINASFIMLPKVPMMRRYADRTARVGYFYNSFLPFSDDQQKVVTQQFIDRWRLEPRDEDVEKWKHGELVEPKKPIIIYIDPATPKQWQPYLAMGVNDWQKAFEQAGFKNAISGRQWPENDTTMHMDDARYSFINYFPSETQNAYGPQVHDPRSGEIIQTHVGWYANVTSLLYSWYMIQAGATDPKARTAKFDDELMGQLIRFVSSHEVGHTLGLMHNFGSSSKTPVDSLRSTHYLELYGHTASIMDYARFNYVAQPEDHIPEINLFPRIGEYDRWAIEWGYKRSGANNPDEDAKIISSWADDRISRNPRLWYGDGQFDAGLKFDPRAQMEDLGDDPVAASNYGIKNLQRILPKLPEWTFEEGDAHKNLADAYYQLESQYYRYLNHVLKYVGGYYRNNISDAQQQPVFVPEPKALQQKALAFFNAQLFNTPHWLLNKTLLDKIQGQDPISFIDQMQTRVLNSLLDINRMDKIRGNALRFGGDSFTLDNYIGILHAAIWKDLKAAGPVKEDSYRRNLQKTYFGALAEILTASPNQPENDAVSIIKADLLLLQKELKQASLRTTDPLTLYHLIDLEARIRHVLDPRRNS